MRHSSVRIESFQRHGFAEAAALLAKRGETVSDDAVGQLARDVIALLDHNRASARSVAPPNSADVELLADALLSPESNVALNLILAAHQRGVTIDNLRFGLIAKAARLLGQRWEDDTLSFSEVTLGTGRIYAILRHMRDAFSAELAMRPAGRRAVFASVPGEDHTLGVTMATDYMRARGWDIDLKRGLTHDELVSEIAQTPYSIIGLSASAQRTIYPLARMIVALRVSNPGAWIMVSGQLVTLEPEIDALVDADCAAADAQSAASLFESRMSQIEALAANSGK